MELEDITVEELKQEVIKRMKSLQLQDNVIENFEKENKIYVSEIKGGLVEANDEQMKILREFEKEKNIRIYHIIHLKGKGIDSLCFLYISNDKEKWQAERNEISRCIIEILYYKEIKDVREIGIVLKDGQISIVKGNI